MTELKPCAHCGGEAVKINGDDHVFWIMCTECSAASGSTDHATYAIDWWNKRHINADTANYQELIEFIKDVAEPRPHTGEDDREFSIRAEILLKRVDGNEPR